MKSDAFRAVVFVAGIAGEVGCVIVNHISGGESQFITSLAMILILLMVLATTPTRDTK